MGSKTRPGARGKPRRPTTLERLLVRRLVGDPRKGQVLAGRSVIPCALGRGGVRQVKREGDGASPRGAFALLGGQYRPDLFGSRPHTRLNLRPTRRSDGWCDDPLDRRYNRPIRLPVPGVSAEVMWREDSLYDLVIDLGYNRGPIRPSRGSAIFLHVARPGFLPTEGCVALRRPDLVRLLRRIGPRTRLAIL